MAMLKLDPADGVAAADDRAETPPPVPAAELLLEAVVDYVSRFVRPAQTRVAVAGGFLEDMQHRRRRTWKGYLSRVATAARLRGYVILVVPIEHVDKGDPRIVRL